MEGSRLYLVVNPRAGRRRAGAAVDVLRELCEAAGLSVESHLTDHPGHATGLVGAAD